MTYYDFDPHNLPQELLAAIGLALTSYAQTERLIQDAIAGCLGIDVEYGAAVTIHMAIRPDSRSTNPLPHRDLVAGCASG